MQANNPSTIELDSSCLWADIISDIHLKSDELTTFEAWRHFIHHTNAQALFLLGDIFEVWVGDDLLDLPGPETTFIQTCLNELKLASQRVPIFVMHGNRDFLLGDRFAKESGTQLIKDPCILRTPAGQFLLSHGDSLCTDDVAYMQFRSQIRSPQGQAQLLKLSLAQRIKQARKIRTVSRERQRNELRYAKIEEPLAKQWLTQHDCRILIHGHTHLPSTHSLGGSQTRWVLSDWDFAQTPPRADVLRLNCKTGQLNRLTPEQSTLPS